jgi:hypothetical protein
MMKAVIVGDRKLMLLGLSEENLKRLKDNQPIKFAGEEVNLPGWDIAIVYGTTEQSLAGELRAAGFDIPTE